MISDDAKGLLENHLLVRDPSQRMSAAQLLQHPWVIGEAAPTKAIPQVTAQASPNQPKTRCCSLTHARPRLLTVFLGCGSGLDAAPQALAAPQVPRGHLHAGGHEPNPISHPHDEGNSMHMQSHAQCLQFHALYGDLWLFICDLVI
jgi:hypothetical protein